MSVTIVSAPSKPVQATTTDNPGSGDATAGQDFANLLSSQLAVSVPQTLAATAIKADLPDVETVSADTGSVDAASADSSSLLAVFGLIAPQPGSVPPEPEKTGKAIADPLTAVQTSAALGVDLKAAGKAESHKTEAVLTGTPAADDKAAKFAVTPFAETAPETAIAKKIPTDTLTNSVPALANNAPGNVNNIPVHRDTSLSLPTPVRDQNWAADFGQKIVWLATNDKQSAQLTLNPPQMGPIEISLSIDKGNASLSFASANAEVRDAIETALPRLREMFASAGIELGHTNVGTESFSQQAGTWFSSCGGRGTATPGHESGWISDARTRLSIGA